MTLSTPLDILKEALLLERRGQAFYLQVAKVASGLAVKAFFETMAEEEARHIDMLEEQFRAYTQNGAFTAPPIEGDDPGPLADTVLTAELKNMIAGAGYEAAAISAAILMEEKAVALYSRRAAESREDAEQRLYKWLAEWEQGHLRFLIELDKDIRQDIWSDNNFWPF